MLSRESSIVRRKDNNYKKEVAEDVGSESADDMMEVGKGEREEIHERSLTMRDH